MSAEAEKLLSTILQLQQRSDYLWDHGEFSTYEKIVNKLTEAKNALRAYIAELEKK